MQIHEICKHTYLLSVAGKCGPEKSHMQNTLSGSFHTGGRHKQLISALTSSETSKTSHPFKDTAPNRIDSRGKTCLLSQILKMLRNLGQRFISWLIRWKHTPVGSKTDPNRLNATTVMVLCVLFFIQVLDPVEVRIQRGINTRSKGEQDLFKRQRERVHTPTTGWATPQGETSVMRVVRELPGRKSGGGRHREGSQSWSRAKEEPLPHFQRL